jgi:hypothetical protein
MHIICSKHTIMRCRFAVRTSLHGSQSKARSLLSHRMPTTWDIPTRVSNSNGYVSASCILSRPFVSSKLRNVNHVDEETLSDYDPTRYCPIEPGSTLDQSYTAMVKLGDTPVFASREMQQDHLGYPILCDLGSAVFDEVKYPAVVQALPYRAPEVILSAAWNHKIDVWNFGVLVSINVIRSSKIH